MKNSRYPLLRSLYFECFVCHIFARTNLDGGVKSPGSPIVPEPWPKALNGTSPHSVGANGRDLSPIYCLKFCKCQLNSGLLVITPIGLSYTFIPSTVGSVQYTPRFI